MSKLKLALLPWEKNVLEFLKHVGTHINLLSFDSFFLLDFNNKLSLGQRPWKTFASQEHVKCLFSVFRILQIHLLNIRLGMCAAKHVNYGLHVFLVLE